ncbi:hypothetical protein LCGC14_2109770, partial [marine sediment metagenome]
FITGLQVRAIKKAIAEAQGRQRDIEKAKAERIRAEKVVAPITPVTFAKRKVEVPLTTRIRQAIARLPGGATILRNVRAGTETLKDIEKRFPVIEDVARQEKERVPEGFVRVPTKAPAFPRRETFVAERGRIREQTFEESLGIKEDKDSRALKANVEKIQERFISGAITGEQANVRLDDELNKFTTKKAVKGLPKNIALGFGLALLQAVPVVGQVAAGAFISNAILRRRQIAGQFRRFPKASAITTAGFLAGGLAGSVVRGGVTSKLNRNIDPESIQSVVLISGKSRTKLITQAKQVNPELAIGIKKGKVTGTIAYEVIMKDGRKYKIVEFNKITPKDIKTIKGVQTVLGGEKNFVGFQTNVAKGETLIGKGVEVITDGTSESFIRAFRFKPSPSPIGRALQRFGFKRATAFDILEKSRVVKQKGKTAQIISEARLSNLKSVTRNLGRRIESLDRKLRANQKINVGEIKNLVNLERRAKGFNPFTEAEFREAKFPALTNQVVTSLINKARGSLNKAENTITLSADIRTGEFGLGLVTPGEAFRVGIKKAPIKKTPFAKTFGKEPITLAEFAGKIRDLSSEARTATSSQLKTISRQITNLKARVVGSPGSITLALANKLETPKFVPGAVPFVTAPSAFFGIPSLTEEDLIISPEGLNMKQKGLVNQLPRFESRIKT